MSTYMGINVASADGMRFADLIVDGIKTLESRHTDSLRPYVGRRVAIVRTGEGPAKAIGAVTVGEPIQVNAREFHNLRDQHCVPAGSVFDCHYSTKWLYPMIDPARFAHEVEVERGIVARKLKEDPQEVRA
jgi:hypothetical protein